MNDIIQSIQNFFTSPQGDAARIFHGRGHCYPGFEDLLIDFYPPVVLITIFKDYPDE